MATMVFGVDEWYVCNGLPINATKVLAEISLLPCGETLSLLTILESEIRSQRIPD